MSEENKPSMATGAELTAETWNDFVARLRHDCVGEGVHEHCTADALFIVQSRQLIYGLDPDYSDKRMVGRDGQEWFSVQEYWDDCDDRQKADLNATAQEEGDCDFLELDESSQWEVLGELEDHTTCCWDERWEYVNSHFTKNAAEAFIKRKAHDYRKGLRVYVDAQLYCWEYNTIKAAILSGRLTLAQ